MANKKVIPIPTRGVVGGGQQQINIDASDLIESKCKGCGGDLFDLAYRHKVFPSLSPRNPTGQDQPLKFETYICRGCGEELGTK